MNRIIINLLLSWLSVSSFTVTANTSNDSMNQVIIRGGYFIRELLEQQDGAYLVQDFYIEGMKYTDPYWLQDKNQLTAAKFNIDDYLHYTINGPLVIWRSDGKKWLTANFVNGKPQGLWS